MKWLSVSVFLPATVIFFFFFSNVKLPNKLIWTHPKCTCFMHFMSLRCCFSWHSTTTWRSAGLWEWEPLSQKTSVVLLLKYSTGYLWGIGRRFLCVYVCVCPSLLSLTKQIKDKPDCGFFFQSVYVNRANLLSHCSLFSLGIHVNETQSMCVRVCTCASVRNQPFFPPKTSSCPSEEQSPIAGFTASWEGQVERTVGSRGAVIIVICSADGESWKGYCCGIYSLVKQQKAELISTFLRVENHNQNPVFNGDFNPLDTNYLITLFVSRWTRETQEQAKWERENGKEGVQETWVSDWTGSASLLSVQRKMWYLISSSVLRNDLIPKQQWIPDSNKTHYTLTQRLTFPVQAWHQ